MGKMVRIKEKEQLEYERDVIINPIKKRFAECGFSRSGNSIKLSDYVALRLVDGELRMTLLTASHPENGSMTNPVLENMQEDECAFEAWAICCKVWLGDEVKTVKLNWTLPGDNVDEDQQRHYNQFLFRVIKFKEWYEWFDYESERQRELDAFSMEKCINNSSSKIADIKESSNEGRVEYYLIHCKENLRKFKQEFSLTLVGNHLPVGVKDASGKSLFTGRQSAVDLWGLTAENVLKLIELKYNKGKNGKCVNIKVGIISELMFYCNIMNAIREGEIKKPKAKLDKEIKLYEKEWERIEGIMLVTDYHPLLYKVKELLELLNSNRKNIKFSMYKYDWEMTDKKLNSITSFSPEYADNSTSRP